MGGQLWHTQKKEETRPGRGGGGVRGGKTHGTKSAPGHLQKGVQGVRMYSVCGLALIHISDPPRLRGTWFALFSLKKKQRT